MAEQPHLEWMAAGLSLDQIREAEQTFKAVAASIHDDGVVTHDELEKAMGWDFGHHGAIGGADGRVTCESFMDYLVMQHKSRGNDWVRHFLYTLQSAPAVMMSKAASAAKTAAKKGSVAETSA